MSGYELPDRTELEGKEVKLELHPWALPGPTRGVFLGQGERGLSIRVKGGGRFSYQHSEVRSVKAAAGPGQLRVSVASGSGEREQARLRRRLLLRLTGRAVFVAALAVVLWVALTR
jgi:hypothetical protein